MVNTRALHSGQTNTRRWVAQGVVGGVLAGILFAMFEMIMAAVLNGGDAFFGPLRMIGGIVLGQSALSPDTSLVVAGGVGVVVHMMLSALFGASVAAVAAYIPQLRSGTGPLVLWAGIAGFGLWIVNFYVIAPLAGWNWFPNSTNPIVQLVAHTLFFGAALGLYLERFAHTR